MPTAWFPEDPRALDAPNAGEPTRDELYMALVHAITLLPDQVLIVPYDDYMGKQVAFRVAPATKDGKKYLVFYAPTVIDKKELPGKSDDST